MSIAGQEILSKGEAINAMKHGAKVTHRFFDEYEYITMRGCCTVVTEEGYETPEDEFWKYRQGALWETDWAIVK